ncbi:hypothetical protein [Wenxinia marina]|uniref:Wenxma_21, whole genome shotgun sequence n=1 Tax=Wenxinia marina DSM 24838 TaxID=1123501 RepID=A0A0D0Q8L7_9RHOB|nr:hypothetical protein [Wenxinia marina]KIQ67468.1 hypothetical protein Wenmar_03891 [Wenxinia marina DSM 24838]GGL69298.1 hypothetical protein GCM10011392_24670 [Wenxinia marina]
MGRLYALLVALAAGPASAQCVTPADMAAGAVFTRANGDRGTVAAIAPDLVRIAYSAGAGQSDQRIARHGLYVERQAVGSFPPDVIGVWYEAEIDYSYAGRPPLPRAGEVWRTTVRVSGESSDHSGMVTNLAATLAASFAFTEPRQVTLGGCAYDVLTATVTLRGEGRDEDRRSVWFPALGFGIETQVTDRAAGRAWTNGLTGLTPAS